VNILGNHRRIYRVIRISQAVPVFISAPETNREHHYYGCWHY